MIIQQNIRSPYTTTIEHKELVVLTEQLGMFLSVYKSDVLVESYDQEQTLKRLSFIHQKLVNQEYDQLINDPSLILY